MPEEILASFEIRRLSILDETGRVDEALMPPLSAPAPRRPNRRAR